MPRTWRGPSAACSTMRLCARGSRPARTRFIASAFRPVRSPRGCARPIPASASRPTGRTEGALIGRRAPDFGDPMADPIDVALGERVDRRQIKAAPAHRLGDGKALAAELLEIDRLQVDGDEEGARLDAVPGKPAAQLVAADAELGPDADR